MEATSKAWGAAAGCPKAAEARTSTVATELERIKG